MPILITILFVWAINKTYQKQKEFYKDVSPKIKVSLFSFSEEIPSPYKYPLKTYELGIDNENRDSVSVSDFRMELIFKNTIVGSRSFPIPEGGEGLTVGGMSFYEEKKDGTSSYTEELPPASLTRQFPMNIIKHGINGLEENTNIAELYVSKWPEKTFFSAKIIVDSSHTPNFLKKPDVMGTYNGMYFFEIKGKKYCNKINGEITDDIKTSLPKVEPCS